METAEMLQLRIRAATDKDMLLGIFFDAALNTLTRLLGEAEVAAIRAEVFGKRSVVSFFRYPAADILQLVEQGVKRSKPGSRSYHQVAMELGRSAAGTFVDSQSGKMMSFLAGDKPHRLLASAPAAYKAVTTFGERSYERVSENSARMHFRADLLGPSWQQGVVEQALGSMSQIRPRVRVEVKNASGTDFTAHVEW
ncbi:TIGR02265 family protein [Archangium sp.]|jgi:uncharacterized protein (TIGR02265 family)|uniref:TIGR02265 family protein n=1 Tax=Archangium sp. TaxID=1872627 RepID=UPI002ED8CA26